MSIEKFATDIFTRPPIVQLGGPILRNVVRSEPFQNLRNAALELTGLPLPEKTFIRAMTGGDKVTPGGVSLSDDHLALLKQAKIDKEKNAPYQYPPFDPNNPEFAGMSPAQLKKEEDFYNENFVNPAKKELAQWESPVVSTYGHMLDQHGYNRDLKLTLGNLSMIDTPDGGMKIIDTWDVDPAGKTGVNQFDNPDWKDEVDRVGDLIEGGPMASLIYNAANALGTYEPIEISHTIPGNKWNSIQAREGTLDERLEPNQGPILSGLNNIYSNFARAYFK